MPKHHVELYLTYTPGSRTVEYYAVGFIGTGRSEVIYEGSCDLSKLHLELSAVSTRLLKQLMVEGSRYSSHSSD